MVPTAPGIALDTEQVLCMPAMDGKAPQATAFTDAESEAQRNRLTFPRLNSCLVEESGFNPR